MFNSSIILAEILLSLSLISGSFPNQTQDINITLANTSSFFEKPIEIKKEDDLSVMNFKHIFGENPTSETAEVQTVKLSDMNFKILNAKNEFIGIIKIGNKSLVINPGSNLNRVLLLESLGKLQIDKIDAVILTDISESTDNLKTIAEMGLSKRFLLPRYSIKQKYYWT